MGKVIMVASGKGGTGKTTAAANLGAALSARGRLTVLVDMDMGLRNLDVALGLESSIVYDFLDLLEGRCTLDEVLVRADGYENLYFIAAPQTHPPSEYDEEKIIEFWDSLRNRFEFCIADSPAGISGGFIYSMLGADSAVIVTLAETAALRDADRVISMLEDNHRSKESSESCETYSIRLVVNRVRPDMIEKKLMLNMDECMDILGIPMLGIVPDDEELMKAGLLGTTAVSTEASAAGLAFKNIAARLCGEDIPIMEFKKKGFWDKFTGIFTK